MEGLSGAMIIRICILLIPILVVGVVAIFRLFGELKELEMSNPKMDMATAKNHTMLCIAVLVTSVMYALVEVLLMLFVLDVAVVEVASVWLFLAITVLNTMSGIAKMVLSVQKLPDACGENAQQGMSKLLLFLSVAEVPALISLTLFLLKFYT